MELNDKLSALNNAYNYLLQQGVVKGKKEFADYLGIHRTTLSSAFSGNEQYLTDRFVARVVDAVEKGGYKPTGDDPEAPSVLVIPYGARGGTIGDFLDGVHEYDCERITSPIKGADYAMEVTGDSMSPEYPSGSRVLIKRVDETAFIAWNEVYVLDTPNGAVIKRVRRTGDPSVVECVSVNPAYQPYTIPRDFIRGWYRVLMVMALK